jgi:SAM-dependent methyltransferase
MSTAEEYIRAITRLESDRRARAAFRDRALSIAAGGTCIFDFGCGPGVDAKFYAAQGFKVIAYDVDARMCASFAEYCRPEMESRQIELFQGDYRYFLDTLVPAIRDRFDVSVITANFAPLSMIDDLRELFAGFHALANSGTKILASVLHPYFVGDMPYRWWWKARPLCWRTGYFRVAHVAGTVFRRSPENFSSLAAPYFTLESVMRGLPGRARPELRRASRLALATSRYMFLLFAKR